MFDFPPVVESLDDVPEPYRALYAEKDGAFHLDAALAQKLDVSGLTSALEKERKAAREAEKALKAWRALGESPEAVAAKLAETDPAAARGAALKAKDAEIARLRASLEKHLIDAAARAEIAAQRGSPALLLPHVRERLRVVEDEGGNFVVRVVDEAGEVRTGEDGQPMTIAELVAEMRQSEDFARAFDGPAAAGSGMPPGAGGASRAPFALSRDQARDPAAYRRVRDEALRAGGFPIIVG